METGLTRVCPLNALLGVDTRSFDRDRSSREAAALQPAKQEEIGAVQRAPADS